MLKVKKYPKRSPYYYVRGTVAGERIFESTGTGDRGQAEAYRIRRERETWQRRQLGIDARQPVSFAEAAIAYMEHTGQKRFMTPLIEHFKERPLSDIGQAEFDSAAKSLYPKCLSCNPYPLRLHADVGDLQSRRLSQIAGRGSVENRATEGEAQADRLGDG